MLTRNRPPKKSGAAATVPEKPTQPKRWRTSPNWLDRAAEALEKSLEKSRGGINPANVLVMRGGSDPTVVALENKAAGRKRDGGDRMMVPEGVVIEGSLDAESDAEISGRVHGNVSVARKLRLGPNGLIAGNVRCRFGQIEGAIEGATECGETMDLGPTGVLKATLMSGNDTTIAGEVRGDVKCGGHLRLTATAVVNGNLRTRTFSMDDGAIFNGQCNTRNPKTAER